MVEGYKYDQYITSLGGGTGHFTFLRGVVKLNNPEKITAIASTWDSGGSSGNLRVKEGTLPMGDYMQNIFGLMEDEEQLQEAIIILRDRSGGDPLVNLLASKAEKAHHGIEGGIEGLRRLFRIRGRVIPVNLVDTDLNAETRNGNVFTREHLIDHMGDDPRFVLQDELARIYLDPPVSANPRALEAIEQGDKVVFTAGSPFTSIFPHLLVEGVADAVLNSKSRLIAVLNLMTSNGEDRHLTTASRWLQVFQEYLGDHDWISKTNHSRIDYLIVNQNHFDERLLEFYLNQGQKPIKIDEEECAKLAPGMKIISRNLVTYDHRAHLLRHDSIKLAQTILGLA